MAKKRYIQKKSNLAAKIIAVGCASCVLTGCIGFGFASAGSGAVHDIDSFGIGGADANVAIADSADFANVSEGSTRESTVLTSTASRDISQGIEAIEAEEEAARIAAEEAARAEEEARIAAAEQAKAEQEAAAARDAASDAPAISNTESSKGAHCFLPYNAWGWGDKSWSSWEEAINAHVAGLANGYGYSITYANAAKYCPPNTDHWFKATIGQMKMI